MGSQPAQPPEQADLLGTSVRAADASCLNAPITTNELHDCIKRLKCNKSHGIDGVLSEMITNGGDVLHNRLLVIFNLMLTDRFPKQLSIGLITAVHKSGDKHDMSNYRGITVGSVIAARVKGKRPDFFLLSSRALLFKGEDKTLKLNSRRLWRN